MPSLLSLPVSSLLPFSYPYPLHSTSNLFHFPLAFETFSSFSVPFSVSHHKLLFCHFSFPCHRPCAHIFPVPCFLPFPSPYPFPQPVVLSNLTFPSFLPFFCLPLPLFPLSLFFPSSLSLHYILSTSRYTGKKTIPRWLRLASIQTD